jgi:hypothetical protein
MKMLVSARRSRLTARLRVNFNLHCAIRANHDRPTLYRGAEHKFCLPVIFWMTSSACGFNRLVVPIIVTGFTGYIFMSVVKFESGIYIVPE